MGETSNYFQTDIKLLPELNLLFRNTIKQHDVYHTYSHDVLSMRRYLLCALIVSGLFLSQNPIIARFFKQTGWVDELGSGVRSTFKYCGKHTSSAIPEFIEGVIEAQNNNH